MVDMLTLVGNIFPTDNLFFWMVLVTAIPFLLGSLVGPLVEKLQVRRLFKNSLHLALLGTYISLIYVTALTPKDGLFGVSSQDASLLKTNGRATLEQPIICGRGVYLHCSMLRTEISHPIVGQTSRTSESRLHRGYHE